jgi:hypothetical protein
MYCLPRITSRSALGASPSMASTSSVLRAIWSAPLSATPRTGSEALVKEGRPASTTEYHAPRGQRPGDSLLRAEVQATRISVTMAPLWLL